MGLYYKKENSKIDFYQSVSNEDCLDMNMTLSRKNGDIYNWVFSRTTVKTWWLTGFKLSDDVAPNDLKMVIGINFKDNDMQKAFHNSRKDKKNGTIQITDLDDIGTVIEWW